jgi:hypothetical protein
MRGQEPQRALLVGEPTVLALDLHDDPPLPDPAKPGLVLRPATGQITELDQAPVT